MFEARVREKKTTGEKDEIDVATISLRKYISNRSSYLLAKRVFDVVLSLIVIIFVFSWLFPIIWVLIRMDSRGPVFFIQKRVGFLGKSFSCLKFRTMYVNEEANSRQATENDPRITRVGRFLRLSNLDELPQFINVIAGHMSIVGPRPHMHKDCNAFSRDVNFYKFRNLMKPGITGLAQVKGYRGPAQNFEKIFRRYQWDAFYIRNAGFWLDLRIIHQTGIETAAYLCNKAVSLGKLSKLARHSEWIKKEEVLN
ncbi:MAG TPA: sugar transferase [Puia sp.]|nr:sugar transferase [Puia sp.]